MLCTFCLSGYANSGSNEDSIAVNCHCTNKLSKAWVGTWSTAPQLVEPNNMPPQPGLSNNTLRQIVRVSLGGNNLRIRFSNEFSNSPVTMKAVQIAVSGGSGTIEGSTVKEVKFNGLSEITMGPGVAITSDPVSFDLKPRMDLAITIYFGQTSPDVTGHPGSRTTSYLYTGNQMAAMDSVGSVPTDHWYVINGLEVTAEASSAAVAILGNSITDGRGSGTNRQNRWPDILAERLLNNPSTRQVGVLNMGIGGNCVLKDCLGPSAISRMDRDILQQKKIRWFIIMEGVNDIGQIRSGASAAQVASDLIAAYGKMIDQAHAQNILAYGATITPIGGSFYYSEDREKARSTVNAWIRTSGRFDAVIDLDKAMQDPENPVKIISTAHDGDFLHPNESGHKIMGEAVDLKLFEK